MEPGALDAPGDKPMAEKLKSAYELAMERLQQQDREQGVERKALSEDQKRRIAELRQEAKAKKAELEILRDERLAEAGGDPAKLQEQEEKHQIDLKRVEDWLEAAVNKIKDEK